MVRRPVPNKEYKNVNVEMDFTNNQYLILTVTDGGVKERWELKYVSLTSERTEASIPKMEVTDGREEATEPGKAVAAEGKEGGPGTQPKTGGKPAGDGDSSPLQAIKDKFQDTFRKE